MKKEQVIRGLAFVVGISLMVFFILILTWNPKARYPYEDLQGSSLKGIRVIYENEEVGVLSEAQVQEVALVLTQVFHYGPDWFGTRGYQGIRNRFILEYHDGHTESIEGTPGSGHLYIDDRSYQCAPEINNQLYELVCRYGKLLLAQELVTLSDKRKEEIHSVWCNTFPMNTEFVWFDEADEYTWEKGVRYYGAYDRVLVLYKPNWSEEPDVLIGGIRVDSNILFYWDGQFHGPAWSYDKGFVTKETLQQIMDAHRAFVEQLSKK